MSTSVDLDHIAARRRALYAQICDLGGETNPAAAPLIAESMSLRDQARAASATRSRPTVATSVRSAAPRPTTVPPQQSRVPEPVRGRGVLPWDRLRELRGQPHELGPQLRGLARAAVERMPAASDAVRELVTRHLDAVDRHQAGPLSSVVLALSDPLYLSSWIRLAQWPDLGMHGLSQAQRDAVAHAEGALGAVRALSLTDSAGGYLIPLPLDPTVILQSGGSRNQVRRVARQVIALADIWRAPTATAAAWSYDAEGSQVSDDAPVVGLAQIPTFMTRAFVPVSIELHEDAENASQQIADVLAAGLDYQEAAAFAIGSGVGQPVGIVSALTGTASEVPAATPGTITTGDLYALLDALPGRHASAPGTAWLASPEVYSAIRQLDAGGGAIPWTTTPSGPLLLDRPALVAEAMSSTLDGPVLVIGDFEHYVIADRLPSRTEFIPHVLGPNGRPSGQHGMFAMARHGAGVTNLNAFRMLVA